ncbi:MAG: hypothetical protein KDA61_21625, partial [Planctomycetales bacterium]|nr:hypothetical protein [Planctomycetales bacterium]
MQRYRVNYRLLLGLAAGSFIALVVGYFFWRYQVERKAAVFVERAAAAKADGNYDELLENLIQYVRLHKDDYGQWAHLGRESLWVLEEFGPAVETKQMAYQTLVRAVTELGRVERPEEGADAQAQYDYASLVAQQIPLRTMIARVSQGLQSLDHIEKLREEAAEIDAYLAKPEIQAIAAAAPTPDEGDLETPPRLEKVTSEQLGAIVELQVGMLMSAKETTDAIDLICESIGYSKDENEFQAESAPYASRPALYRTLAAYWHIKGIYPERVNALLDQMVKVNPDSAEAWAQRSHLLLVMDRKEDAAESLQRARELDPESLLVLRLAGELATQAYGEALAEEFPEAEYSLESMEEEAVKLLGEHLTADRDRLTPPLKSLADSFASNENLVAAVNAAAKEELKIPLYTSVVPLMSAYYDARSAADGGSLARRKLSEALGQLRAAVHLREAEEIYARVLTLDPNNPLSYQQVVRMAVAQGRYDDALKSIAECLKRFDQMSEDDPSRLAMLGLKGEVLLAKQDVEGFRREIRDLQNRHPTLDAIAKFYETQIQFIEKQWREAASQLAEIRGLLPADWQAKAATMQGACYENLGEFDLAIEAYNAALSKNKDHHFARLGLRRAMDKIGVQPASDDTS